MNSHQSLLRLDDLNQPVSLEAAEGCEAPVVWLRAFAVHSDWPAKDGTLLRDVIRLRRGLNVLWAKPAPPGTKNRLSGHATGKTTFCRLVRYLLCDTDAGTKDFRQRFQSQFPRGWVFGEVVIGQDEWLVGRSLSQLGYNHFAKRNATLADAVGPHPLRGGFDEYEAALEAAAFERVKLRKLSGTNRDLKWDCLIQWLARDQEARFSGLLEWRNRTDSDSESPDLSAADKENLVRIVLGLVEKDEQKLLRDHAKKAGEHTKLVNQRPSFVYHAEQQRKAINLLAKQEVAKPNEPLLREAIKTTVADWRAKAEKEKAKVRDTEKEEKLEAAVRNAEAQLLILNPQLKSADEALQKLQGTLFSTQQSLNKKRELDELRQLPPFTGVCSVPLADAFAGGCKLAAERHKDDKFEKMLRDAKTEAERNAVLEKIQRQECTRLTGFVRVQEKARDDGKTALRTFREGRDKRLDTAGQPSRDADALESARLNYETACQKLAKLDDDLAGLEREKRGLDQSLEAHEHLHNKLILRFSRLYEHFAKRLLGDEVSASIEFAGKAIEPRIVYHGPYDSTALKLAKYLAFDLTSLALGVVGGGHHPRFLLHDSPREADLTSAIYHELFHSAIAIEDAAKPGEPPFQYIITTTEPPPEDLRREPWLLDPVLNALNASGRLLGVDL